MNYYDIGQRIRKYRKANQLSQEQLADMVGISATHLSHIETGNTKLSLPVFVKIADSLSIKTDELLNDISDISSNEVKKEILELLDNCSTKDTLIIKDLIKSVKISLDKYND